MLHNLVTMVTSSTASSSKVRKLERSDIYILNPLHLGINRKIQKATQQKHNEIVLLRVYCPSSFGSICPGTIHPDHTRLRNLVRITSLHQPRGCNKLGLFL